MNFLSTLLITVATACLLSGCAYKPLKAPCSANEGTMQPMSYVQMERKSFGPFAADTCGPMRPVNQGQQTK